jgi:(S)-2-hydroxyglutarate dehydrogenase
MNCDILIAGAGMVGLSTAYQLLNLFPDKKIIVLEKETDVAKHQTSHNSGVMHSGIYYKPGSYKANNCINGYHFLIAFCDKHSIPYQLIGKLIVATREEELVKLQSIYQNGIQNKLQGLSLLSTEQVKEIEPNVTCLQAIRVPQSGIIDYKVVAHKLKELILESGSLVLTSKNINGVAKRSDSITIRCSDQSEYNTSFFINCAGLQSDRICQLSGIDLHFRIIPFKGNYFRLNESKKDIVNHLIYPVPDPAFPFLGIHYTRLINGDQTLGPNAVLVFGREAYKQHQTNLKDSYDILSYPGFWKLLSKHWKTGLFEYARNYSKSYFAAKASLMTPGIQSSDLLPGHCGIRAQLIDSGGNMLEDFVTIRKENMIHVCNAPSPAATAGLAIGLQITQWYSEMIE